MTDSLGSYILRNLPAGKLEVRAPLGEGTSGGVRVVVLSAEPVLLKHVNIAVR